VPGLLQGRERELAQLVRAVDAAAAGRGSLTLVEGEPGIGKTRLAHEAAVVARSRGQTVLVGRCRENGGRPPLWPWVQVLTRLADSFDDRALTDHLGDGASYLVRAVPALAARLGDITPVADVDYGQFVLVHAARTFLERAAADRPLVILLDDLHAADPPSLELLAHLITGLPLAPVLIVGTVRSAATGVGQGEEATWQDLFGEAERLELSGLARDAVARLGEEVAADLATPEVVTEIHRLTDGHPLYVLELARLVASRTSIGSTPSLDSLPRGVGPTLRARLAPFAPAVLELLEAAAVLGRRFDPIVLAEMTGLEPTDLIDQLSATIEAGVVEEEPDGRYGFTHALFREGLVSHLPAARRVELHAAAADAIERLHDEQASPHLVDVAYHRCRAVPGADPEVNIGSAAAFTRGDSNSAPMMRQLVASINFRF
jgi:predicted ATPase